MREGEHRAPRQAAAVVAHSSLLQACQAALLPRRRSSSREKLSIGACSASDGAHGTPECKPPANDWGPHGFAICRMCTSLSTSTRQSDASHQVTLLNTTHDFLHALMLRCMHDLTNPGTQGKDRNGAPPLHPCMHVHAQVKSTQRYASSSPAEDPSFRSRLQLTKNGAALSGSVPDPHPCAMLLAGLPRSKPEDGATWYEVRTAVILRR